jgi:hypothetical protein
VILFKKQLFDFEVKGQGPMKVIMVHDTPPYGHIPNIIDLSRKTKRLWSGQASLRSRRSGRRGDIILLIHVIIILNIVLINFITIVNI